MKRICAWCNKSLDPDLEEVGECPDVSHGVCEACKEAILAESGTPLVEFLDSLPAPVLMLDGTGEVVKANRAACSMLGKRQDEIAGFRGGEVFECAHSRLPGGCGNTVHCSGCVLRQTVMGTYESGQPCYRRPASLQPMGPGGVPRIHMYVTTMKVGTLVLLRVHPAEETGRPQP